MAPVIPDKLITLPTGGLGIAIGPLYGIATVLILYRDRFPDGRHVCAAFLQRDAYVSYIHSATYAMARCPCVLRTPAELIELVFGTEAALGLLHTCTLREFGYL